MIKEPVRSRGLTHGVQDIQILDAEPPDYDFLGKNFDGSKVLMACRMDGIKAIAAYQTFPRDFYVHSFWALEEDEQPPPRKLKNPYSFDAQAVSSLCLHLRRLAANLGYDGVNLQVMSEQMPLMAFLQMKCKAIPVAMFAFMPNIRINQ